MVGTLSNAGHAISEKVQEVAHGTSKKANKEVAKDPNVPIGTRVSAGKDAMKDAVKEGHHSSKGRTHRELI